ncbi:Type 1 glutamine amidotransferase-like domain-containing protein [Vallitalea pronyensis]|uniref:Type 1 glutamine amidotransferase-like domain-containing protein n=1 Tax=Vallitalea pronyensis TaxID=1348613 RepID=A0A8J8SJA0_9FIRM|nr:Type 1 glutamine amidotransferase-like domain-containing protein [Vallitalea pronyensis]
MIAIGGGEIRYDETLAIDKEIVLAANKEVPEILFIPTASGEPQGYVESIQKLYGQKLGCKVKTLYLLNNQTSSDEAREMILNTDIIYVGGGNTKRMLQVWKQYSVDKSLKEAYEKGVVLSGLSAGSICWFESGQSDSNTYEQGVKSPYIRLKALGLIPGLHCPHYNEDNRLEEFDKMVQESSEVGIAIENNCAIDFKSDEFRIIKSDKSSKAYRIYKVEDNLIHDELTNINEYKSIDRLFNIN